MPPKQANWLRLTNEAGEAQPEATTSPHQESTPEREEPAETDTVDTVRPAPLIGPIGASTATSQLELPKNLLTNRFAELAAARAAQIAAH